MRFANANPKLLYELFWAGLQDGVKASWSIIKIMVPVSLAITLLKYFGVVQILSQWVAPVCGWFGLRGGAILALISGYLINTFSAIAVMATLSLTAKEIAILASMVVICHALPLEATVQQKAGGSFFEILMLRIAASLATGLILNQLLPAQTAILPAKIQDLNAAGTGYSLPQMLGNWFWDNKIVLNIIAINIVLTVFYKFLLHFGVVAKVSNFCKYLMFIFGLSKESALLWMITNSVGLIFGASLMVEAKNNRALPASDLRKLNLSLATCHSLIQESANFLAIGAPLFLLILPRLVWAILSVWTVNLVGFLKPKLNLERSG